MDQGLVHCKCGSYPTLSWVTPTLTRMYCILCGNSTEAVSEQDVHRAWQELNAPFLPFVLDVSPRSK